MNKIYLLFIITFFNYSCSSDDQEMKPDFSTEIIGTWQLDKIRVEGIDCQTLFGVDVPEEYLADEIGCASPDEILGNSKRCINVDFRANGEGTFLWSVISGQLDAPITYTIMDDEIKYCFVGSSCSGSYRMVGNNLESVITLSLDQECNAIFVLKRK